MKVFALIHEQDTDAAWDATTDLFLSKNLAQEAMRKSHEDAIKAWGFDISEQTEEHCSECLENSAVLRDDTDIEKWRIEEKELDVEMAVEVKGGLVQNIYANTDVYPEVYDLDTSDYSTEDEEREADRLGRELEQLKHTPGWRSVW